MLDYNVNVYLRHTEMENMYIREIIDIVAQDTKAYTFKFTLYDDEVPYDLTSKSVYMIVKSESGTIIQDKCTVTNATSGLAEITLPNDMFCEAGTYQAEVQIWEGTSRLTSLPFDYKVRLSLQNNKSIIADNRYSLLQECLDNVANANITSTQAIATAREAKSLADGQIATINSASTNAKEALDRATNIVSQNDITDNKVVQNGLIDAWNFKGKVGIKGNSITIDDSILKSGYLYNTNLHTPGIELGDLIQDYSNFTMVFSGQIKTFPTGICTFGETTRKRIAINNDCNIVFENKVITNIRSFINKDIKIEICNKNGNISIIINGDSFDCGNIDIKDKRMVMFRDRTEWGFLNGIIYDLQLYNRPLTPLEIQHNFSVLNNTPSINKINNKALSTDTYHVTTPAGITTEERYTGLLKTVCKEFISDGNKITVSNVIPNQKILSGEIKGQTVKNYYDIYKATQAYSVLSIKDNVVNLKLDIANPNARLISNVMQLKENTSYIMQYEIKMPKTGYSRIYVDNVMKYNSQYDVADSWVKVSTKLDITTFTNKTVDIFFNMANKLVVGDVVEIRNINIFDYSEVLNVNFYNKSINSYIPFGLNSTNAIINDNPIYEPMINGATKVMKATKGTQNWTEISPDEVRDTASYDYKLVNNNDLGSVPTVCDYIDRGRKVKVINTKEIVLNGSEDWKWTINYAYLTTLTDISPSSIGIGDIINFQPKFWSDTTSLGFTINSSKMLSVRLNNISSISELKTHLTSNPITVRYQLATPIEVPLTDEEIAQYDQYRKVIELGKVGDVCDTLEIKDDGSGVWTRKTICKGFDDLTFTGVVNYENGYTRGWIIFFDALYVNPTSYKNIICDKLETLSYDTSSPDYIIGVAKEGICLKSTNPNELQVKIQSSKLETTDTNGLKKYLVNNGFKICYQLATPITTHIPKELVPQILSQTDYTFSNAVLPSGVKISVPVDKIADFEARLKALEGTLIDVVLDK